MLHEPNPTPTLAGIFTCTVLLVSLIGCVPVGSSHRGGFDVGPSNPVHTTVPIVDDYDYYPRYEVYYNRRRNEFIYYDVNAWVRRSTLGPRGITVEVLWASPSVRADFHDSPELHHGSMVQRFPRNWEQSPKAPANAKAKDKDNEHAVVKGQRESEDGRNN